MNGEAVKELAGRFREPREFGDFIVRPNDWTIEDKTALVKAGPTAKTLGVWSLGAVRDYLAANRDTLDLAQVVVHIASPSVVRVYGPLHPRSRTREQFLEASCDDLTDGFLGEFMALEEFLVGLQVRFAQADDRHRLLSLLSNVKHETVKTAMDDGVTQVVQARAGVALVSDVAVPNPVLLCGYRTFRDVPQPSSLFVLRVNAGRAGGLPEVGLFEADGGAWKLQAVERVKSWLAETFPAGVSVLA